MAARTTSALPAAIVLALVSGGATSGDAGAKSTLFNQRALLVEHPGDTPLPCFDRAMLPVIGVPRASGETGGYTVRLGDRSHRGVEAKIAIQPRGDRLLIRVLDGASELSGDGTIELSGSNETQRWPVRWITPPQELPELSASIRWRRARRYEDARREIEPALASASPWIRTWAHVERGTIDFVAGDQESARRFWLDAADLAVKAGIPSEASARLRPIGYIDGQRGRYVNADASLRRAEEIDRVLGDVPALARDSYLRGLISRRTGEHLLADRQLHAGVEGVAAAGDDNDVFEFSETLALELLDLGRYREALRVIDAREPPRELMPSQVGTYLLNQAWVKLIAMEAGELPRDLEVPARITERALELQDAAARPQLAASAAAHLALIRFLQGKLDEADQLLARLDGKDEEELASVRWFAPLVKAQISIARGQHTKAEHALRAIEAGARKEVEGRPTEDSSTARILIGDVLLHRKQIAAAIREYQGALDDIEALARGLEVPRSAARYMFRHQQLFASLANALLRAGRNEEALWALDRERALAMEDLETDVYVDRSSGRWRAYQDARAALEVVRADGCEWVPPSDRDACEQRMADAAAKTDRALAEFYASSGRAFAPRESWKRWFEAVSHALGPDEALLSVYRLDEEWIGFFLTGGKLSPPERGKTPPVKWLERAKNVKHVYLVLGDRTGTFDPAQLTSADANDRAPLAAKLAMSWLPNAGMLTRAPANFAGHAAGALFVADPDTTLPAARTMVREYAKLFASPSILIGEQATRDAVTQAWSGRSVVHFAGHGSMRDDDPSSTRLVLALEQTMGMEDVLAARPAIGLAVLEGCTTGARPLRGDLGLPHALLASGTRTVLATVRELRPGETSRFMHRFYEAGGAEHPGVAFRDAVLGSISAGDPSWSAFRLWGHR